MHRRSFLTTTAGLVIGAGTARAAGFPEKALTFVVPFAPGGISDIMGRAIAAAMSDDLGQPIVVVNKGSPGLVLGLSEVARARPDGYTIGIWYNTAYTFPMTMKATVPYDGIEGFTFLGSYGEAVLGVVVRADAPWHTLADLIEEGKRSPGKLKFGTVGVNSTQHVLMEMIMRDTGARFVHVPQVGTAAGIAAVLGGHLDFLSDASSWAPNVRQGQMRLLAYTGDQRSQFFPDVPTFAELGHRVVRAHGAIAAPANLPPEIKARLEASMMKALRDPRVADAFKGVASEIAIMDSATMRAAAIADRALWAQYLASNG